MISWIAHLWRLNTPRVLHFDHMELNGSLPHLQRLYVVDVSEVKDRRAFPHSLLATGPVTGVEGTPVESPLPSS